MPRISQFYGIIIVMYYNDHSPPHFHAKYGDDEVGIAIDTLAVIWGGIPQRSTALVLEWAAIHRDELRSNWDRARLGHPLSRIAPLS